MQSNLPVALLPPSQLQTIFDATQNNLPEGLYLPHKLNSIDTICHITNFYIHLALPESKNSSNCRYTYTLTGTVHRWMFQTSTLCHLMSFVARTRMPIAHIERNNGILR